MTPDRDSLIQQLAGELTPVRSPGRADRRLALWWTASWTFVVLATLAVQPMREGFGRQLIQSPHFLLESLLGLVTGGLVLWTALQLAIPRPGGLLRRLGAAPWLLALWVGAYLLALEFPALDPSMAGKREGCNLQVLTFGTPPLLLGLALVRRLAPVRRALTGALVGAAAGAIPGLLMQMACMYLPAHILSHHIAPIAVLAVAGAALGPLVLRRL